MDQKPSILWKNTMTYGAYLGLIMIIFEILVYFIHYEDISFFTLILISLVPYIILTSGSVLGIKHFRDKQLDGQISYYQAMVIGTQTIFFASILMAFYTYFFNTVIDPEYLMKTSKIYLEKMMPYLQGQQKEQIELLIKDTNSTPHISVFDVALSISFNTVIGMGISLITAAFLRKKKPMFPDDTTMIQS